MRARDPDGTLGGPTPRTAVWVALSICLVCAFADEAHQSMRDFLIDAFGATAMLTIARGRPTAADGGPRAAAAAAD